MVIRSRFTKREPIFSPCGNGIEDVFEERLDKNGVMHLVKTGEHDLNEFIQASHESTKVYSIIDRFALGDVSALEKVRGFFADVTGMPSNLAEVHNLILSIDKKFSELPVSVREKFNNSSTKFAESLQSGEISKILGEISSSEDIVPDVKTDSKEVEK